MCSGRTWPDEPKNRFGSVKSTWRMGLWATKVTIIVGLVVGTRLWAIGQVVEVSRIPTQFQVEVERPDVHSVRVDTALVSPLVRTLNNVPKLTWIGSIAASRGAVVAFVAPANWGGIERIPPESLPKLKAAPKIRGVTDRRATLATTRILLDPERLQSNGVTFGQVRECVEWHIQPPSLFAGGTLPKHCELPAKPGLSSLPQLVVGTGRVKPIRLQDIAKIRTEDAPTTLKLNADWVIRVQHTDIGPVLTRMHELESAVTVLDSAAKTLAYPSMTRYADVQSSTGGGEDPSLDAVRTALGEAHGMDIWISDEPRVRLTMPGKSTDTMGATLVDVDGGLKPAESFGRIVVDTAPQLVLRGPDQRVRGYVLVKGLTQELAQKLVGRSRTDDSLIPAAQLPNGDRWFFEAQMVEIPWLSTR